MRFRKNVPAEHREFLQEQLKQYKKEITMSKDELRELEKWVASGRSPYDNGDYIYSENGCPMDFVSAMRFQDEIHALSGILKLCLYVTIIIPYLLPNDHSY